MKRATAWLSPASSWAGSASASRCYPAPSTWLSFSALPEASCRTSNDRLDRAGCHAPSPTRLPLAGPSSDGADMSYPPQQPGGWPDQSWPSPAQPGDPPAYGYGGYGAPVTGGPTHTNGMSIAAMVVSLVGAAGLICYGFGGLLGIVGAILGHVARKQIRERGEGGDGMALAGIIVGWIATALAVIIGTLIIVLVVWTVQNAPTDSPS